MGLDSCIRYDRTQSTDIVGWRKNYDLHNLFCKISLELRLVETPEDFNCVRVPITQEILDRLISDVKANKHVEMDADLEDLKKVQEALDDGIQPYYWSWW